MARTLTLRDHLRETRMFMNRVITALVAVSMLVLLIIGRLAYLQVAEHGTYTTLSEENRVNLVPIAPTRGLIYDRNGILLADNRPSYSLEIVPEQVKDRDAFIDELKKVIAIDDEDIERYDKLLKRKRRFDGIPIRLRLNEDEVARFAVNRHRFPGARIHARLTRHYPLGPLTTHALGFVGRINERELQTIPSSNYAATQYIGKLGVEKFYETLLHGEVGHQQVETNARGRILRVLERTTPVPGSNLYLTIDSKLQQVATEALGNNRGAVVAIEPASGAVLALVSTPVYDGNLFVGGIPTSTYQGLRTSPDRPLFNRALSGQYPPGSTIKPFIALAGLDYGVVTPEHRIFDPGWYRLPENEHRYRDWKRWGHGWVDIDKAIVESCDTFFYDLGLRLGIDRMHEFLGGFGLGRLTGIDHGEELPGLLPSRAWKRGARNQPWFPGETLITAIGQGFMLTTPLQLASATAALANRGRLMTPHLVHAVEAPERGNVLQPAVAQTPVNLKDSDDAWNRVIGAMETVVHGPRGTARRIGADAPFRIAGKTGTAQVFGIKQDEEYVEEEIDLRLRDHALFIGFAPVTRPRIAVAVVVENGGSGGATAAPVARAVMDYHLREMTKP